MLQSISWLQFTIFLLVGLLVYYGYAVYWKYGYLLKGPRKRRHGEVIGDPRSRKGELAVATGAAQGAGDSGVARARKGELAVENEAVDRVMAPDSIHVTQVKTDKEADEASEQVATFPAANGTWSMAVVKDGVQGQLPMEWPPEGGKPEPKLEKAAEKLIQMLRTLLNEAAVTTVDRGTFEGEVQRLLLMFSFLRGTLYDRVINSLLVGGSAALPGLEVAEEDMPRFWGASDPGEEKGKETGQETSEVKRS